MKYTLKIIVALLGLVAWQSSNLAAEMQDTYILHLSDGYVSISAEKMDKLKAASMTIQNSMEDCSDNGLNILDFSASPIDTNILEQLVQYIMQVPCILPNDPLLAQGKCDAKLANLIIAADYWICHQYIASVEFLS